MIVDVWMWVHELHHLLKNDKRFTHKLEPNGRDAYEIDFDGLDFTVLAESYDIMILERKANTKWPANHLLLGLDIKGKSFRQR